jgi:hypothetical protein
MRTVNFEKVLEEAAAMLGVHPGEESYTDKLLTGLCQGVNRWLRIGWEYAEWPELMVVEERYYLADWNVVTTYDTGDQCYYGGAYWESLVNSNVGNVPAEGANWTAATDYDKVVSLDQEGLTPIGTVFSVSQRNPNTSSAPFFLGFALTSEGIQLSSLAPTSVFVRFRLQVPEFTVEEWDETETSYTTGSLVLASDGECYVGLQAVLVGTDPAGGAAPTYWQLVEFPAFLRDFVKLGVRADQLRVDNQDDKADAAENKAFEELVRQHDRLIGQQDQVKQVRMAGYG